MNITFILPRYHTNLVEVVSVLKSRGHEISMLVYNPGKEIEDNTLAIPKVLKVIRFYHLLSAIFKSLKDPNNKRRFKILSFCGIYRSIFEQKPDLIIIRNIDTIPAFQCFIVSLLKKPKILLYHQTPFYGLKTRRAIVTNIINTIFNTVSFTPVLGESNQSNYKIRNNFFLPFPVPKAKFEFKRNEDGVFHILTVAKFEKRKKLELLLLALRKADFSFKLTIIGQINSDSHEKYFNEISDLIARSNMGSVTHIYKSIPYNRMNEFYQTSNLFILPSENEPFSTSVLEAISNGLPVICSDTCGSRHYVQEGFNGYIFQTNDVDSLLQCIKLVKINSADVMGRNSNVIAEKFNDEHFYNSLIEIVK